MSAKKDLLNFVYDIRDAYKHCYIRYGKFRLEIGDDGIGIAKEDLNYIFERLYRCNKGRSGKGNGLGLNISKLLLEKMGGTISAFSEPGKGTVFCIEFSVIQR